MYDTLVSKLCNIESSYKKGIEATENIFESLAVHDIRSLPKYTATQTECMANLKVLKEDLRQEVNKISKENGIDNDEMRLMNILKLFPQIKKESLIDLSRNTYELEIQLQKALYRNQEFLATIMSSTEALLETAIDYNENELSESHLFLDEKF